jgi:alcohol dehydrogenase
MRKVSLAHDYLYPKYAVLDPSLTLTLTRRQTAVSGIDALSHAIEGYWSNQSTSVSYAHALAVITLMLNNLPEAYRNGEHLHTRHMILEGSLLAGLTISNAKTTAVHAVSYPMTVFFHIPHGLACSLILPSFIRYNAGSMRPDKEHQLLTSLNLTSMDQLAEAVEELQEQLDLPIRLRDLGLSITDIATIVDNGFRPDRMNNNPREVTPEVLHCLLEEIL